MFSKNFFLSFLSVVVFIVLAAIASFMYSGQPGTKKELGESRGWQHMVASWLIIKEEASQANQAGLVSQPEVLAVGLKDKLQEEWLRSGGPSDYSYANINENIWRAARLMLDKVLMRN